MINGYKWANPYEWLMGRIDGLDQENLDDVAQLVGIAKLLATDLTGDQIQDAFQSAMSNDGYFEQWVVCPDAISGKCLDDTCRHNEVPHVRNECCSFTGVAECPPCRAATAQEMEV